MMRSLVLLAGMSLVVGSAFAEVGAIGNDTPTAEQAQDKVKADTVDEATEPEPFRIPAGYQPRKRGTNFVHCKKSMESGTRFSQEKCFSEEQLRAIEMAREQNAAKFEQTRKICATVENCGNG